MTISRIDIKIESSQVQALLDRVEAAGVDMSPVFRKIAAELISETEDWFAHEGPGWPDLAEITIENREKKGHWPGKMLQVSGQLAASVGADSGPHHAEVGASKIYAAIQQLGGPAGRNLEVDIPPRPYLPIDEDGNLDPKAEEAVGDVILLYFAQVAR